MPTSASGNQDAAHGNHTSLKVQHTALTSAPHRVVVMPATVFKRAGAQREVVKVGEHAVVKAPARSYTSNVARGIVYEVVASLPV